MWFENTAVDNLLRTSCFLVDKMRHLHSRFVYILLFEYLFWFCYYLKFFFQLRLLVFMSMPPVWSISAKHVAMKKCITCLFEYRNWWSSLCFPIPSGLLILKNRSLHLCFSLPLLYHFIVIAALTLLLFYFSLLWS